MAHGQGIVSSLPGRGRYRPGGYRRAGRLGVASLDRSNGGVGARAGRKPWERISDGKSWRFACARLFRAASIWLRTGSPNHCAGGFLAAIHRAFHEALLVRQVFPSEIDATVRPLQNWADGKPLPRTIEGIGALGVIVFLPGAFL